MPLSTDVKLRRDYVPKFPDRCIACSQDAPGHLLRVSTHTIGLMTLVTLHWGSRFSAKVPVCRSCARAWRLQAWLRRVVTWTFAIVGVAVAFRVLSSYRGVFRRWIATGIAVACCLPLILWQTFFSPLVDLTAFAETVDYEFRDRDYADEFAALNEEAVLSVS